MNLEDAGAEALFYAHMEASGREAGRRLAGLVEPFVKHVRDLRAAYEWLDRRNRLAAGVYSSGFIEAWWEATP